MAFMRLFSSPFNFVSSESNQKGDLSPQSDRERNFINDEAPQRKRAGKTQMAGEAQHVELCQTKRPRMHNSVLQKSHALWTQAESSQETHAVGRVCGGDDDDDDFSTALDRYRTETSRTHKVPTCEEKLSQNPKAVKTPGHKPDHEPDHKPRHKRAGKRRKRVREQHKRWDSNPSPHGKKQPYLSQEFIKQHAVEHHGKLICKYFLAGKCFKEQDCNFGHEMVQLEKKPELCKFYIQGFCTKGEKCLYMHNDFPCKFFHTGAKCYQSDQCRFSHDPLTEQSRILLQKVLNKSEPQTKEEKVEELPEMDIVQNELSQTFQSKTFVPRILLERSEQVWSLYQGSAEGEMSDVSNTEAQIPHQMSLRCDPIASSLRSSPVLIPLESVSDTVLRDPRPVCQPNGQPHPLLSWPSFAGMTDQRVCAAGQSHVNGFTHSALMDSETLRKDSVENGAEDKPAGVLRNIFRSPLPMLCTSEEPSGGGC